MNWLIHKGSDSVAALPILSTAKQKIKPFFVRILSKRLHRVQKWLFFYLYSHPLIPKKRYFYPPHKLRIVMHKEEPFYSIGIDIGGTSSKIGLVDQDGRLLARRALDTQATSDSEGFTSALANVTLEILKDARLDGQVLGIGIGAPGVDERAGTIAAAANLPFREPFALGDMLVQQTGLPARLVKDSSAAIVGERTFGGAKGMDHFILITLGTGLGSALMIHGKVITGSNGLASEYGHSPRCPTDVSATAANWAAWKPMYLPQGSSARYMSSWPPSNPTARCGKFPSNRWMPA